GDYMYAIGQKEEKPKFESLSWSLGGLRDRDGGLPGANPGGRFEFKGAQPSFKFILEVDGARAHAFIENRWVGTYHTVDGQPIEGYVGFGSTFGAFKLQGATVTRLDRAAEAGVRGLGPEGLDLTRDGQDLEATLRNRDVRGMPRVGGGLVVAWIPRTLTKDDELDVDDIIGSARFALRGIRDGLEDHRLPQELALALPADLPEEDRLALAEEFGSEGHPLRVLVHHRKHYIFDLKRPNMPHEPMPVLMYVDPHAVLRICEIYAVGRRGIPERLAHWGRVFRPL
ncbi:MAG: hypothetical protein KDB18_14360, partial [Salinibacterium sp.]|nr:hypothetical protein [Salinibacterium sp.]